MRKKILATGMMLLALSFLIPGAVFANSKQQSGGGFCSKGDHGFSRSGMFNRTAMSALKSKDQLGLSKEQTQAIYDLKSETSKNENLQQAQIKNVEIDLRTQLQKADTDLAVVQKLIDQKYDLKKINEKASVEAFVKLKKILSVEQLEKLKTLKQDSAHRFWKKGKSVAESEKAE